MLFDEHLEEHLIDRGAPRPYLRALDLHLELLMRLTEEGEAGDLLRGWLGSWYQSMTRSYNMNVLRESLGLAAPLDGDTDRLGFVQAIISSLDDAETYYIDEHMIGFIADVADSMPDDYTVDSKEQLPSPHGFAFFATPVQVIDRHGREFLVRAVTWSAGSEGYTFTDWSYSDEDGEMGESLREAQDAGLPLYPPTLAPLHMDPVRYGEPYSSPEQFARDNEKVRDHEQYHAMLAVLWMRRFMAASWLVMHGKVGRPRKGIPSKRQQSQMKKRKFDWGDIRIVELRRTEPLADIPAREKVGREVTWTHRWAVSGFWRWQWYPGEPGPCPHCGKENGVHRRIYIDPYVKGPEHLPYIAKDRIYVVKR